MSKTGESTEKSMAKVLRFINNYSADWIQKAFADDAHLAQHLQVKWDSYAKGKDSSYEAMVKLMTSMDAENENKLMKYIDETFAKGGEIDSQVKKIVSKFKPIAEKHSGSKKEGYSVLVKDKNSDFSAWVDVYIRDNDVSNDWNKYIFNLKDSGDVRQKALQENNDIFESATSEAVDYLEKKGAIYQDDKGWHYGDKKSSGGEMAKGGEVSKSELKEFIKEYNQEFHIASDLKGEELRTLDESEVDDFISWAKRIHGVDVKNYYYKSSGGSMGKGGKAKFTYYYAKNENPYVLFKVKELTDFRPDAQDRVRTIARENGMELAGGSTVTAPHNIDDPKEYRVIEVPDDTIPTDEKGNVIPPPPSKSEQKKIDAQRKKTKGKGKKKSKSITVFSFDDLSDDAQDTAIENERNSRYEGGHDYAQWAVDDDYLFEPKQAELDELFGKDFHKKLNAGSKYPDAPIIGNNRKNIYFDTDRNWHLDASNAIEVNNDYYFLQWLGIPKEMIDKVHYSIQSDGHRNADTIIEFEPNESGYDFTTEENEILNKAEKKFKDHMEDVLKNIKESIDYNYTDKAIKEHLENLEGDEDEYDEDGSKAEFAKGGVVGKLFSPSPDGINWLITG